MKPTTLNFRRAWTLLALLFFAGSAAFARAQSLPVPGSVSGNLPASNSVDTYSVTAPVDGDVTFTITTDNTLYALLTFWDSDGATQVSYIYCVPQTSNSLLIPHLSPGATYYISVQPVNGNVGGYSLSDTEATPPNAKAIEPNDTPQTALAFLVNKTVTGHVGYSTTSYNAQDTIDFWKFKASVNGDVAFTLKTDSTLYALLSFLDKDGVTTISYIYITPGTSNTLTIPHLGPGATYYVSVEMVNGNYGSYKLSNKLNKQTIKKAREPNDTFQKAQPFALNSTVTGIDGYSTKSYYTTDNIDFWKVTVANSGTLTVQITTNTLYALVRILNTDGTTTLTYIYCTPGTSNTVSYALPAAGTYFVSVEMVNGNYGGYILQNTF